MKAIHLAAALGVLLLAGSGNAPAGQPTGHKPLRPLGECMRTDPPRDWGVVDARRVVVRTRDNRYYDISLQDNCPAMATRPYLTVTEVRHGAMPDGRVCGEMGEALIPRGFFRDGLTDRPCRIANVRRIDKQAFDAIFRMTPVEARHFLDEQGNPVTKPGKPGAGEMASR